MNASMDTARTFLRPVHAPASAGHQLGHSVPHRSRSVPAIPEGSSRNSEPIRSACGMRQGLFVVTIKVLCLPLHAHFCPRGYLCRTGRIARPKSSSLMSVLGRSRVNWRSNVATDVCHIMLRSCILRGTKLSPSHTSLHRRRNILGFAILRKLASLMLRSMQPDFACSVP